MHDESTTPIKWRYAPMGEAALLVEGVPVCSMTNRYCLALAQVLDRAALSGVVAVVPAINTVLVTFAPNILDFDQLHAYIQALLPHIELTSSTPSQVIDIPVVYGGSAGPDLDDVAALLGLTPSDVVAIHTAQIYVVMMIGFAPGFPYIGLLPDQLMLPRRATPRPMVPAGSVAIAVGLTGIYPAHLPGGWHLIGQTAFSLFDPTAVPPARLTPGDSVRFQPLPEGTQP